MFLALEEAFDTTIDGADAERLTTLSAVLRYLDRTIVTRTAI